MPFIPASKVIKVVPRYDWSGHDVVSVFHVQMDTEPDIGALNIAANVLLNWYHTVLAPNLSIDIILVDVTCTVLTTESGLQIAVTDPTPEAGNIDAESVPLNTAFVVTSRTALSGRSYRGRTFLPGIPETSLEDNSHMSDAGVAGFVGVMTSLLEAYADEDMFMSVVSYQHANAPRVAAVVTHIETFTANKRMDTQRRRLQAIG